MKTIPPPCPEPEAGPKYWRSLDDLADAPEFQEWVQREFPAGASEFTDPVSRRYFVKIMSASFLFGGLGLTGCRRPVENILPFGKQPPGYIHGVPQFYATARPDRGSAVPLLVKSNEGRPTKVEGNAAHPASNGSTDVFSQASILDLYDPDRAMRFARNGTRVDPGAAFDFLASLSKTIEGTQGQGLAIVAEQSSSPSRARLQQLVRERYPGAQWAVYEPVDFTVHQRAASQAFGQPVTPEYRIEQAARILSLDCDFLGTEQDSHRQIRAFANGRRIKSPNDEMNRLYVVEGLFTITGGNADHRLRVPPSAVTGAAAKIALEVLRIAGINDTNLNGELNRLAGAFLGDDQMNQWIVECAKDLANPELRGRTVILPGQRQPLAVHVIAHAINAALGNVGQTVLFRPAPDADDGSLAEVAEALHAGRVNTLVILGGNPVYNAPAELDWAVAQGKARTVVRLGYYEDESSWSASLYAKANPKPQHWDLPAAHWLESWGDARSGDGTIVPVQPLIEPLFGGITELEVLARLAGQNVTRPYEIVREGFAQNVQAENPNEAWNKFLHDGFLEHSTPEFVSPRINPPALSEALQNVEVLPAPSLQGLEVVFHRDYTLDDGRYNNNGWLQELPDPVTKMVWENAILLSPTTAQALNLTVAAKRKTPDLKNNDDGIGIRYDVVEIELGGRKIRGPVWIQPGMADNVLALALGYGRERTGRVGQQSGYNAYVLRTSAAPHIAAGGKLSRTGQTVRLVSTQEHGAMEGRPIVREANLEQYRKKPDFAKNMGIESHAPNAGPIYRHPYNSEPALASKVHQWGMSIDLTTCVGCNACVVACQSENNVPIVGKDQVRKGREMHWLRMDRYYSGDVHDPQVATQPMLCQHCESAPCEYVCPVNATVHDNEGLNVMVYNRCVGTRYCSNNCAWKVRRFNFFDYNKRPLDQLYKGPMAKKEPLEYDLIAMSKNPDVTVRMRGVMEKCTFCTQRIEQAKIAQKIKAGASDEIQVPDGTIQTACQQACPAEAIVFGNILDPESQVSQLKAQQHDYAVLGFLDTKPRLTYLGRIRNPNPAMPDYHSYPLSYHEYKHGDPLPPRGSYGAAQKGAL
jgi:MoCo/4Fe-4S cofactor protein with predicted Tat translocation signal